MDSRASPGLHEGQSKFYSGLIESLNLYAKQLAWLYATPKHHKDEEDPKSRVNSLDKNHPANTLPEIDPFLAKCFQLAGICLSGGMSVIPLTWQELDSFISRSGYILDGWESEQIINMSRVYCSFSQDAKELGCPAPYQDGKVLAASMDAIRDKVAKKWAGFARDAKPVKRL